MIHRFKNGTTFSSPFDEGNVDPIEWRLRYNPQSITEADMLVIASMIHSYTQLILATQRKRNEIMSRIKNDILEITT